MILLAIMALGLVLRCIYFVGIGGFDDISYLVLVNEIINGTFSTEFHFDGTFPFRYRSGILFPTAAMYLLFGPNEYSAAIFPFLVSMATIWLAWRAGKLFSPLVATLSALFMATLPIAVVSATSLLPTVFSAFFSGVAVVFWIELEELHKRGSSNQPATPQPLMSSTALKYLSVGLLLGIAYLFRVEVGIIGMVFIAFGLIWFTPNRGWFIAALGIALVIGVENIVYYSLHGEWFFRLKMISQGFAEVATFDHSASLIVDPKSPVFYAKTLFFKPTDLGLHGAAMTLSAFATLFAVKYKAIRPILVWFWFMLLYLTFGTWSFETYVPTTKNPRYLMNVAVPGAVLSAVVIAYLHSRRGAARMAAWFGMSGVIAGSLILVNPAWVYRYENAAGSRLAAGLIRQELATRGDDITKEVIQAEYYTAINIMHFLPEAKITKISHADLALGAMRASDVSVSNGFVIHDEFLANKYEMMASYQIPYNISTPPDSWDLIASRPRDYSRFQFTVIAWLSKFVGGRIQGLENSLVPGDLLLYQVNIPTLAAAKPKTPTSEDGTSTPIEE